MPTIKAIAHVAFSATQDWTTLLIRKTISRYDSTLEIMISVVLFATTQIEFRVDKTRRAGKRYSTRNVSARKPTLQKNQFRKTSGRL